MAEIHHANLRLRASKGRAANGNVIPLKSFSAACRNSNFLQNNSPQSGAIGFNWRNRRYWSEISVLSISENQHISLRHRRCSYIVTSMEDIERTRMANSSISRQNVSNNFQSLNILLHDVVILDPISYAQDLVLLS